MKAQRTQSLLEKALEHPSGNRKADVFDEDDFELIEAWLSGRIALAQVKRARGLPLAGTDGYSYIARGAREMWKRINGKAGGK